MPKWGSQDYKNAVFDQLAKGSSGEDDDHFQHFENFSANAPRRDVEAGVHEAFHPERLSREDVEPQLLNAASKMKPQERAEIAHDLMGELQDRGLTPSWIKKMLGLCTSDQGDPSPDDLAKLSEYARQNHPEAFKRVMADKPFLIRWMDKPLVAALVGVIAGKLLNRGYDR